MDFRRGLVAVSLAVAVGSTVAAMNWYGIWHSFALLDTEGTSGVSVVTVEGQAMFQQWTLVTVVALMVCVTAIAVPMLRTARPHSQPSVTAST